MALTNWFTKQPLVACGFLLFQWFRDAEGVGQQAASLSGVTAKKETTMKNVTRSTMILAAAALTFSVTTAFAQGTGKLKAEIPFSFRIGNVQYQAGTYEASVLETAGGVRALKIVNLETGAPRIAVAPISTYPSKLAEQVYQARLVFACTGSDCALSQVWPGNNGNGMQFRTPSVKRNEPTRLATIRLRPTAAD